MMLTSDISLTRDPTGRYQKIVSQFAQDQAAFDHAWKHAWYKLTTRDMGPVTRCLGPDVPPPQPFQFPLPPPPPPGVLADMDAVRALLAPLIAKRELAQRLGQLAWQCASTFRVTDYQGGCNGARIRFPPQKEWAANAGLEMALEALAPIKQHFDSIGFLLSWSDLIMLAGTESVYKASGSLVDLPFCEGRTDASDGAGSQYLERSSTLVSGSTNSSVWMYEYLNVLGLAPRQYAALVGAGYAMALNANLTNVFFVRLLSETWTRTTPPAGTAICTGGLFAPRDGIECQHYKAAGSQLFLQESDLLLKFDAPMRAIADEFAGDQDIFLDTVAEAWTYVANADRFDGPVGSMCKQPILSHTASQQLRRSGEVEAA